MDEIEKKAAELAEITVRARMARYGVSMEKAAAPQLDAKRVLGYGAAGAGIGAAGAGLLSYAAKRKKERMLRDILLGGLVGGVGGAAIPILQSAPGEIRSTLGGDKTPEMKQQEAFEAGERRGESLPGSGAIAHGIAMGKGFAKGLYNKDAPFKLLAPAAGAAAGWAAPSYHLRSTEPLNWKTMGRISRYGRFSNIKGSLIGMALASLAERLFLQRTK